MEDLTSPAFMPMLNTIKELKCDNCGYTLMTLLILEN